MINREWSVYINLCDSKNKISVSCWRYTKHFSYRSSASFVYIIYAEVHPFSIYYFFPVIIITWQTFVNLSFTLFRNISLTSRFRRQKYYWAISETASYVKIWTKLLLCDEYSLNLIGKKWSSSVWKIFTYFLFSTYQKQKVFQENMKDHL